MWLLAWRIAVQIFYIAVVVAVFSTLDGRTETLIVALFGLTFAVIRNGQITAELTFGKFSTELQREFDWIKVKLIPDVKIDWDQRKNKQDKIDRIHFGLVIEAIGLAIISLICLYKIVTMLF